MLDVWNAILALGIVLLGLILTVLYIHRRYVE